MCMPSWNRGSSPGIVRFLWGSLPPIILSCLLDLVAWPEHDFSMEFQWLDPAGRFAGGLRGGFGIIQGDLRQSVADEDLAAERGGRLV